MKSWLLISITLISLLLVACSTASEHTSSAKGWHNYSLFKPLFGDFDSVTPIEGISASDKQLLIKEGMYLANAVAACGSCHSTTADSNDFSGGRLMQDSFGYVHAPNITPDQNTGIGKWNLAEISRAIRASIDKQGRPLSLDLHRGYRWMSDRDVLAIAVYLKSIQPVTKQVARRKLGPLERNRWGIIPQHAEIQGYVPELSANQESVRGRYLTHNVGRCAVCHTDQGGMFSDAQFFAGSAPSSGFFSRIKSVFLKSDPELEEAPLSAAARKQLAAEKLAQSPLQDKLTKSDAIEEALAEGSFPIQGPDIRGSSPAGLQDWNENDLIQYLKSGKTPVGSQSDTRLCPWTYYSDMRDADKQAIAKYIKSL